MTDSTKIQVPLEYSRSNNTNHNGIVCPINDRNFKYGTAGFRARDYFMPFIAYRSGVFAGYRARQLGKTIGLMITASHNPYADNGIKLVDPMGEMLDVALENHLTDLINMGDDDFFKSIEQMEKHSPKPNPNIVVYIGYDTRPSSPLMSLAATTAVQQTGIKVISTGLVTTPQLHYKVRATNDPLYGPSDDLTKRFIEAVKLFYEYTSDVQNKNYSPQLFVDCANGVGAKWVDAYTDQLANIMKAEMFNINTTQHEVLNKLCGADYVKIEAQMPNNAETIPVGSRCCSLDGDADRLIYYYNKAENRQFHMLDGDHIAALFATFVLSHLRDLNLLSAYSFGVIQTAYANGNSTRYFKDKLGCTVKCVKTGTKYLQLAARDFDLAVHFEANGHGTVAYSEKFRLYLDEAFNKNPANKTLGRLYAFSRIINECVGDGIADMLAVEQILRYYDWSIQDWEHNTYQNADCVQIKIPVKNRDLYETAEDSETVLISPPGIQNKINEIISQYKDSRAFARPSGTENIVRVYAEAATKEEANSIVNIIRDMII